MTLNLGTGALGANPNPDNWRAIPLDEAAARAVMGDASLVLRPMDGFYATRDRGLVSGGVMYPRFGDLATVARSSGAVDMDWSHVHGAPVGPLFIAPAHTARLGRRGILMGREATNLIRNPLAEGPPDALPTHWQLFNTSGLTITYIGPVAINNYREFRYRIHGTAPAAGLVSLRLETLDQMAVTPGERYTLLAAARIVDGSLANVTSTRLRLLYRISGVSGATHFRDCALDDVPRGFVLPNTLAAAGENSALPQFEVNVAAGDVDLTIGIAAPCVMRGAVPVPPPLPNPGSPGSAVQAADTINIPNGSWANAGGAGTLYIEAMLLNAGVTGEFPYLGGFGVSADNSLRLRISQTTGFGWVAVKNSAVQFSAPLAPLTGAGQIVRAALAWAEGDYAQAIGGQSLVTQASGQVGFGAAPQILFSPGGSSNPRAQYLRVLEYYPRRKSNDWLTERVSAPVSLLEELT